MSVSECECVCKLCVCMGVHLISPLFLSLSLFSTQTEMIPEELKQKLMQQIQVALRDQNND